MSSDEFWEQVVNTGWWQLLIVILAALLTQFFGHVFLLRRKKKERITELASKLMLSGRQLRSSLISFHEFNIDFTKQQMFVTSLLNSKAVKANKADVLLIQKEAAFISQKKALDYLQEYTNAQLKFIDAAYLLTGMHFRRFDIVQDKKFWDAINEVQVFSVKVDNESIEKVKKKIDKKLLPHLEEIETLCHNVIYEQNRTIGTELKAKLSQVRGKLPNRE